MYTENEIQLIERAIESMMPDLLANGLTRKQARILYMGQTNVFMTNSGLFVKDRKLNDVHVEDHIKAFVESFEKVQAEKTNPDGLHNGSDVAAYFEKNNTPESEKSEILAKAMKNEGFDINA